MSARKPAKKNSRNNRNNRKKPDNQIKVAKERIKILFEKAEEGFERDPSMSHRWVKMAKKIAMRYNIRLPREMKRRVCKKCLRFLVPGTNSRVRTNAKQLAVIVTCMECGNVMRFPYRKEKKKG